MSARPEVGDNSCENEVSSDLNVHFEPSAGSRNQGCVLFVFGSQRGDAEFAEVRGDIDFVLCDSLRSRRLRDKNYNIISLKWH